MQVLLDPIDLRVCRAAWLYHAVRSGYNVGRGSSSFTIPGMNNPTK